MVLTVDVEMRGPLEVTPALAGAVAKACWDLHPAMLSVAIDHRGGVSARFCASAELLLNAEQLHLMLQDRVQAAVRELL